MTESQNEWTSISLEAGERDRIKVFADRGHRNLRQQILVWLDAAEALMKDGTPDLLDKAGTVQNLSRPTLDETV